MFYVSDLKLTEIKKIYDADELAQAVKESIEYYQSQEKRLRKENQKLHDDAMKIVNDELRDQIQFLQDRLDMSYGSFASQKEKDAYLNFQERHMHERTTSRAQGGKCPYLIPTGTGIGTILYVKCPICGEEEDITDMEAW